VGPSLRLHGLLDAVSRQPLPALYGDDGDGDGSSSSSALPADVASYAEVLRCLAILGCLASNLAGVVQQVTLASTRPHSHRIPPCPLPCSAPLITLIDLFDAVAQMLANGVAQRSQHEACAKVLARETTRALLRRVVEDVYVGCQLEMARAKGAMVDPKTVEKVGKGATRVCRPISSRLFTSVPLRPVALFALSCVR